MAVFFSNMHIDASDAEGLGHLALQWSWKITKLRLPKSERRDGCGVRPYWFLIILPPATFGLAVARPRVAAANRGPNWAGGMERSSVTRAYRARDCCRTGVVERVCMIGTRYTQIYISYYCRIGYSYTWHTHASIISAYQMKPQNRTTEAHK